MLIVVFSILAKMIMADAVCDKHTLIAELR